MLFCHAANFLWGFMLTLLSCGKIVNCSLLTALTAYCSQLTAYQNFFFFIRKLQFVETLILAASCQQFVVRALLDDATGFDDDDCVRAPHSRQPVGDYDRGTVLNEVGDRALNELL